jgi:hypothetical protein
MGQSETKKFIETLEDIEALFEPCDKVDGDCIVCPSHDKCWDGIQESPRVVAEVIY